MLTLRSCCPFRYAFLSHNLLKPTAFSAFSLSFSNKDNIFLIKPLSLSLNPKRKMSSRPSAFDALMSNARAAAKKKPQPTSSSPKKRKTLDNQNPKTINSSATKKIQENTEESSVDLQKPIENDTVKPKAAEEPVNDSVDAKAAEEPVNDCEKPGKKVKLVNANERIAELKSKILLLKKKAGDFDPKMVACWERGERVPFIFLSLVFDMISNETGRILITDIVCNMLRTVMDTTPEDLVAVVYLAANKVAPAHEGLELGIGDASIIKALAEACGRTETQVKKQYKVIFCFRCVFSFSFFLFGVAVVNCYACSVFWFVKIQYIDCVVLFNFSCWFWRIAEICWMCFFLIYM